MGFATSALLIIDVQNDFCPNGALAVSRGDEVIGPLNDLALIFSRKGARVIATQDWHPGDHVSFASSHPGKKSGDMVKVKGSKAAIEDQVLWPDHCVQNTQGAEFYKNLDTGLLHMIIRKGYRKQLDSYSAFFENDRITPTGLDGFLKGLSMDTVFLGGLATDYCVFYSAMDAIALGYRTYVIKDAVRGVGYPEGSVERALETMENAGVILADSALVKGIPE